MRSNISKILSTSLFMLMLILPLFVHSHPGRTDANGGHWDRKNGEYHFHTGEHAGKGGGGGYSHYEYEPFSPPYEPPTENPYRSESTTQKSEPEVPIIITIIGTISAVFFSFFVIKSIIEAIIAMLTSLYAWSLGGKAPNAALVHFENAIQDFFSIYEQYIEAISHENQFQKVSFPYEYAIGVDGLPCERKSGKWGKTFSVYRTSKGNKLHLKYKCCHATIKSHIYNHLKHQKNISDRLCRKCFPINQIPDFKWYENYLQRQKLIDKTDAEYKHLKKQMEFLKTIYNKYNSNKMIFFMNLRNERKTKLSQLNNRFFDVVNLFNNIPAPCHQPYINSTEEINDAYEIEGLTDFMSAMDVWEKAFDAYSKFADEYGTIEPGENPARDVQIPKKMDII